MFSQNSISGVGIGLRMPHYKEVLTHPEKVGWIELLADNWLYNSSAIQDRLLPLVDTLPITLHGVGLSIGSSRSLDWQYLGKVKELINTCNCQWYSEHLSLSWIGEEFFPDLLPLTYTRETLKHVSQRIIQIQDFLKRPLLIENISSYNVHPTDILTEAEFIKELCQISGCYLLLDINNLYVNHINLNRDAYTALATLPLEKVKQIHLGGHEQKSDYLLDSHSRPIADEVWQLYRHTIDKIGAIPTLIEWDNDLPSFNRLIQEKRHAEAIMFEHSSLRPISSKSAV